MNYKVIELSGYTNKNTASLYYMGKIETHTSFDAADYDYGDNAERALSECKALIETNEKSGEWIPGIVTAYISEY